ncbi:hypothetical protein QZH41_020679, partial [Actinostola sp. cb2023]
ILISSRSNLSKENSGHVFNLISNDTQRLLDIILQLQCCLILQLLEAPIAFALLCTLIGWQSITGGFVALMFGFSQVFVAKLFAEYRFKQAVATDKRLAAMNQIIKGIRAVKMYAWEWNYRDIIKNLRRIETFLLSNERSLRKEVGKISQTPKNLSCDYREESKQWHAYYNMGNSVLENMDEILPENPSHLQNGDSVCPSLEITQVYSGWVEEDVIPTIHDITLDVMPSTLLMVTGPVGSGKSTLLMAMLREIPLQSGTISSTGDIAYVSQIPWIFTATVRENILFGKQFDQTRYEKVLDVCDLKTDIDQFPKGDLSVIGQQGVMLSGGQRARVGLARAVYSEADIFLLDDPLSAVDAKVGQHIFDNLQNCHTKALSLVIATSRWVGLYTDMLCAFFVTVVAFGTILLHLDPATTGILFIFVLALLRHTSKAIRLLSDVETQMVSVERVQRYTKLPSEPGYQRDGEPPRNWPNKGALSVQGLSMVYLEGGVCVLKDVSFDVKPQEKVGIAGRTGAGKSSLVASLFRMPDPQGHILVDGIDLGTLNIRAARRSMAVISQNPVLFSGTLKHNLDPFNRFTEEQIWTALTVVQMRDRVSKLDGLLEYYIGEIGSGFSVGETQLLCLARALLQRCKILVLDEATSNVDYKTDELIQQVIREKFANCTVLTIAHRLNTIMDYDRVLVLDRGHVVEYDSPAMLAAKSDGVFAQLVQSQQGNGTSDTYL